MYTDLFLSLCSACLFLISFTYTPHEKIWHKTPVNVSQHQPHTGFIKRQQSDFYMCQKAVSYTAFSYSRAVISGFCSAVTPDQL